MTLYFQIIIIICIAESVLFSVIMLKLADVILLTIYFAIRDYLSSPFTNIYIRDLVFVLTLS